jgi:hypothetical protein
MDKAVNPAHKQARHTTSRVQRRRCCARGNKNCANFAIGLELGPGVVLYEKAIAPDLPMPVHHNQVNDSVAFPCTCTNTYSDTGVHHALAE